ncbi:MAG: SdiA-regulated domain-containing protein, partial [Myxococcales bacterium]|nr:SdiA-regulated domain-containing protein [Myxococcales bacterium]
MRLSFVAAAFACASFAAGCHHDDTFVPSCTAGAPPAGATTPPSHPTATSAILPGGRAVTPAGTLLATGGYPIALRILPGDRYAVVTDDAEGDQALRVVDLHAADPLHAVASAISYPIGPGKRHTPGLFYGLALNRAGTRLYVSNGGYDPVDDSAPPSMHYNTYLRADANPPNLADVEAKIDEMKRALDEQRKSPAVAPPV